ncbi:unnamed protein product [Gordionus sp. m RMFG-2023]
MRNVNSNVTKDNLTCPYHSYTQKVRLIYSFPMIVLIVSFVGIVANAIFILSAISWDRKEISNKIFRCINRGKIKRATNKVRSLIFKRHPINSRCNARKRAAKSIVVRKSGANRQDNKPTWIVLIRILSLTDIMISVFIFYSMFTILHIFKNSEPPLHFLRYSCLFHNNILNLLHGINNHIKVIMAVIRCVAIKYPFRYKDWVQLRKIIGTLAICTILCCIVTIPEWYDGKFLRKHTINEYAIHYDCLVKGNYFVAALVRILVHDLLPMVITIVAHLEMIRIIYKKKHVIAPLISTRNDNLSIMILTPSSKITEEMSNNPNKDEHHKSKTTSDKLSPIISKLSNNSSRRSKVKSKDAKDSRVVLLIHTLNIEFCLITISYIVSTYNAIKTHTPLYLYLIGYLFLFNHCCEVFMLFIFNPTKRQIQKS